MAKEKQTRRMIAMALAAAVTVSSMPVVALADTVDNLNGTSTTTTSEVTKDETTKEGPSSDGELKVTIEKHERTEETKETTKDNATGDTVSTTETTTDTVKTTTTTETSQTVESDNKTVESNSETVKTTETTTITTVTTPTPEEGNPTPEVLGRTHETTDNTTTTTETTADGTVETVVNQKTEDGTREDGTIVDSETTSTTVTTTDAEGNATIVEDGTETTITQPVTGLPEVSLDFDPETNENATANEDGSITVKEEVKISHSTGEVTTWGENGVDYESKEVITEIERIVEATLSTGETKVEVNNTDLDPGSASEDYEGKFYDKEGIPSDKNQPQGLVNNPTLDNFEEMGIPDDLLHKKPTEAGYDFVYVGDGDSTNAACPVFMKVVYQKNEDGTTKFDEKGNPVIDLEKSGALSYVDNNNVTQPLNGIVFHKDENGNIRYLKNPDGTDQLDKNGNKIPLIDWENSDFDDSKSKEYGKATWSGMSSPGQIVLKKDGEYFYTYCIDSETGTDAGAWYKISNLEDAGYYDTTRVYDENGNIVEYSDADHIRAVVENGYWGTEEGTGSLSSIKDLMTKSYGANDTVTVTDANGTAYTYNVHELINGLKEHEALACTQGAIWSYSNGSLATQNGEDGKMVIGVQSADKKWNSGDKSTPEADGNLAIWYRDYGKDYSSDPVEAMKSDARMKALYECLMGLGGKEATDVIINEDNSIDDMTLVVGDKVEGHVNNLDDNTDNDVYNTSVDFKLAFVPDSNSDDIVVYVMDKNNKVMKDANGAPIVRRLAGENSEGESYNTITADENGVYRLTGLVFQENEEVEFDLKLEGTQYLDKGVYIYQAYDDNLDGDDRNDSQTLVGIASGKQDVTVSKSMTLTFDVDENSTVTATRKWHKESGKTNPPTEDPTTPPGGDNPPSGGSNPPGGDTNIPDGDVPLSDIPDEDVPLADIGEDEVPLASAPAEEKPMVLGAEEEAPLIAATGDSNHMAAGFGGMLAALAGMFMLKRKKEH